MYRNLDEHFGGNGYGIHHKKTYNRLVLKARGHKAQVVPGAMTRLWVSKTIWRRITTRY